MVNGLGGNADGAGDSPFAGRPVGLHDGAIETQKRCAARGLRVHPAFDGPESVLGQEATKLASGIDRQLAFEHGKDAYRQALASLEDDVADESIAHDDFDAALKQVVTFDVADEVEVQLAAEPEGGARQVVAFALLGADVQDADARVFIA